VPSKLLSKSRYLNGLQCHRLLWIATNQPERIPEPDAATQHIFNQGHLVGELAKKLFLGGTDVPANDFMGNIAMTKELLHERRPLFEAGVLSGQVYSRADILNPVNDDEWDIVEVKSSTSVKEVNIHDVSFQKLCWENAGLKIRKCFLACINNQYVRNDEIDPQGLFIIQDITDETAAASEGIRYRINDMLAVISSPRCPKVAIGPHCSDPYDCALAECWEGLPEHSVFTLYFGGKKSHELYGQGILDIMDIPADYKLNDKQRIQYACVVSGQPYIDAVSIKQFLSSLQYPLYFLDFETINPAIPLFDGTRPYQNTPFQFSLHVQGTPSAEAQHYWHLADGPQDPRPELLLRLHHVIGNKGSVVVYNQSFEQGVLRDLGTAFPEYREWSEAVISRLVDLIVPFRNFHYYHPLQKGSASIKAVLPAITGRGYEGLAIAEGGEASSRYLDITYGVVSEEERLRTREELLAYCGLDTEGMVRIIKRLEEAAR
jgi:hypothetical protein